MSVNSVLPLLLLNTRAVKSPDPVAILVPSGDHATDQTTKFPVSNNIPNVNDPELTAVDGSKSVEVCTAILNDPLLEQPIVKPVIVTTKNADEGIADPAVVMTTEVLVVALHVPVSPATLLLPAAILGMTDVAKKPEGYVNVIVPPEGIEFAGVNPKVTGTDGLPTLRSLAKMLKYTSEMGENSPPDSTAADGSM